MKKIIRTNLILVVLLLLFSLNVQAKEVGQNDWTFAGWYGGGMYPSIVPDPNIEGRLYLTSDVAGLWRSDDRGENWYFINKGLINLNIPVLAIAPSDSNILYLGTKAGMMRSDNGGKSWNYLPSTKDKIVFIRPDSYRSIAIAANDSDKVYAGTKSGEVFYSTDGGINWDRLGSQSKPFGKDVVITALQVSRDCTKIFIASKLGLMCFDSMNNKWEKLNMGNPELPVHDLLIYGEKEIVVATCGKKLALSYDYGNSWKYTSEIAKGKINRLAVSKDTHGNLKLVAGWQDGWKGGVFLSEDNRSTWVGIGKNLKSDIVSNPTRVWMKGFQMPNSIRIDPFNPSIFYYTDSWGVWRSDDNGTTWNEKIKGAPNSCGSDITISSDGKIFVASMDDGLLQSSDGGETYEALLPNANFYEGVAGHVWRVLILDKIAPKIVATCSPWSKKANQVIIGNGVEKHFKIVTAGLPDEYPRGNTMWDKGYAQALAVDPKNEDHLYLGIDGDQGGGLFISWDGGLSWKRSEGQPGDLRIYNGLVVDPTEPRRIFWSACGKNGGVYRSSDCGKTWEYKFQKPACIFDLTTSKKGVIYAAGVAGTPVLYVSYDHGDSWNLLQRFEEGGACEAITIDPDDDKRIFVGVVQWDEYTGGKIFYSSDGGKNWKNITNGLPSSTGPSAMAINAKEKMLYILLYAGSVYKRSIASL